jgi:hypothetical protein
MSALRSSALLIALVVLLAAVAACAGTASPSASASLGAGTTPAPASQPVEPSTDGGTGTVNNPPIVDGAYTSGKLHVEISGDVTATLDFPLQGGMSMTTAGATLLSFADTATSEGGGIVIASTGNAITLSTKSVSTAGGNSGGDSNTCTITVSQSDASKLAGTFDCKRLVGIVATSSTGVTIDMRGTFEASR